MLVLGPHFENHCHGGDSQPWLYLEITWGALQNTDAWAQPKHQLRSSDFTGSGWSLDVRSFKSF